MPTTASLRLIEEHVRVLVDEIGPRPPGSPANRTATDHLRRTFAALGLPVRELPFTTRWWEPGPGLLGTPSGIVDVAPDPFSPPCDLRGRVHRAASPDDVAPDLPPGTVLVLLGEQVAEQLTPTGYPFFSIDAHTELLDRLRAARPAAVIAVSASWQPIFEDPGFGVPCTTVRPDVGERLVDGEAVHLELGGVVRHGDGVQVSAVVGGDAHGVAAFDQARVVLAAHVDCKVTTPGALDNAGGVAVVLAATAAMAADPGQLRLPVEVVPFNGEDHADPCGELAWLAASDLGPVVAAVNLDGVGCSGHRVDVCCLSCPASVQDAVAAWAQDLDAVLGAAWFESDHAVFAFRGTPAVAVTSHGLHDLMPTLLHTPRDTRDVLDTLLLDRVSLALPRLLDAVSVLP